MPPRLLIIEHSSFPKATGRESILSSRQGCERRIWDDFVPETLFHSRAQLVLAHAVPSSGKAALFFQWLRTNPIRIPTLAILPEFPDHELLQSASDVIDDFVLWPVREEELDLRIERIIRTQSSTRERLEHALAGTISLTNLVGQHPLFLRAVGEVPLFAESNAPVLVTGETGTGKELFAHAIHWLSKRQSGPFIPVDCGSLPEQLAENELFGHCRGAFTDAHADQKGLAGMADGGTLFLDEIDALSAANQAKLLRFLQEGTYRALGADRFTRSNVRIIAATNHCIEDCINQRLFRADLYFRLNVLRLQLPALRERHGDVSLLAKHFLEKEGLGGKNERKFFSPGALRKLESYHWPGNARELFNTVQRAAVCSFGKQITPEDISIPNEVTSQETASSEETFRTAKQQVIEKFERAYVEAVLARHHGNITQAAREAGKERRAFGRLAKKYGIGVP